MGCNNFKEAMWISKECTHKLTSLSYLCAMRLRILKKKPDDPALHAILGQSRTTNYLIDPITTFIQQRLSAELS